MADAGDGSAGVVRALEGALRLPETSLVIHRAGTLVELRTDQLAGHLVPPTHDPTGSWQIGPFDGDHCHLTLAAVEQVELDAEPVPCQGGRPNLTIWFLSDRDCGNPHRHRGYFSVTARRPYDEAGAPRPAVLAPFFLLADEIRGEPLVTVTPAFDAARTGLAGGARSGTPGPVEG